MRYKDALEKYTLQEAVSVAETYKNTLRKRAPQPARHIRTPRLHSECRTPRTPYKSALQEHTPGPRYVNISFHHHERNNAETVTSCHQARDYTK